MTSFFKPRRGGSSMISHKVTADEGDFDLAAVAIGTRRFTRKRGRIICIERHGTNAARGVMECEHGISAAHPITKPES